MAGCVWKCVGVVVIYGKYYQHSGRKRRRARKGRRRSGQLRYEGVAKSSMEEKRGGKMKLDDGGAGHRKGWREVEGDRDEG